MPCADFLRRNSSLPSRPSALSGNKGRRSGPISLAPLTPDEAMRALLKVDPKDVAKPEARERAKKSAGKKKRGK